MFNFVQHQSATMTNLTIDSTKPAARIKFRKTGGSFSVIIPAANASAMGLTEGATGQLWLTETGESVIVPDRKPAKPKYALGDLLAEVKDQALLTDLDGLDDTRPAGSEI
jgi:antitoxin component of MazEF toxin-antitoxin module